MTIVNSLTALPPPVVVDFGWYFGTPASREGDTGYEISNTVYPPGLASLNSSITLPNGTIPTTVTSLAALRSSFTTPGTIILATGDGRTHAVVDYTSLDTISGTSAHGVQGFTGCMTDSSNVTFPTGSQIYDPRDYVDSAPLRTTMTFDALDSQHLGLPAVTVPSGVSILNYEWDFGNNVVSKGSQATATFSYTSQPNLMIKLTVVDSLGRRSSCTRAILFKSLVPQIFAGSLLTFNGNLTVVHTSGLNNIDIPRVLNMTGSLSVAYTFYPSVTKYPSPTLYP